MSYMELKRLYPVLVSLLGCLYAEQMVWEMSEQHLIAARRNQFSGPDSPTLKALKREIEAVLASGQAKEILEVPDWFVGDFESEEQAQLYVKESLWDFYFPDNGNRLR